MSGAGLIDEPEGISRRALYKRAAKLGAGAITVPLIYSVAIRPATASASLCTANCPTGTVIPCGTGTCTANPNGFASTTACASGDGCYRGVSNNTCYCTGGDCVAGGGTCDDDNSCCAGQQFCAGFPAHVDGTCAQ